MARAVGGGDSRRTDHRNARKSWSPRGKDGGDDACELEAKIGDPGRTRTCMPPDPESGAPPVELRDRTAKRCNFINKIWL